jgi:hypothetical protein
MQIRAEDGHLLAKIQRGPTRFYMLELQIAQPVCLTAWVGEEAWQWHVCFGHVSFSALRKMASAGLVQGLPVLE